MKLKDLLKEIDLNIDEDIEIKGITCNSKEVKKDYLFIAINGNRNNGSDYIEEAFNKKAAYVLSDSLTGEKILKIANLKELKAKLFYKFYDYPQNNLQIIGVTGTNGKTSTAYLIYNLLNKLNKKCMYIGTLGVIDGDYVRETNNTTPDCEILSEEFKKAVKRKTKYVVMEVSSHSLALNRVNLINFKGAKFCNDGIDCDEYGVFKNNNIKNGTKYNATLPSRG